ncbi:MAG: methyltransferase domain-containing protein [bacterium]|nr:methyltransferase domain-containing protein [bacterium]
MKPSLVPLLACPQCKKQFDLLATKEVEGEVMEGTLSCIKGHKYPVQRGVPRLFDEKGLSDLQIQTKNSFDEKWKTVTRYREDTSAFYQQWYLDRYGFGTLGALRNFLKDTRTILDAGTGLGRDAEMYARNSTAQVIALDLSYGIEQTYKDLGHLPNLHLVQADLTSPPIPEGSIDFLACDQVIHHTPDIRESFKALARLVRKGGYCAVYVYRIKGPIREFCDDYIRRYSTEMDSSECFELSEAITQLGKTLAELNIEVDIPKDIPVLGIKAGRHNLQRFFHWHIMKCFWNEEFEYLSNVMINYDWYHPKLAHRHPPEEVRKWVEEEGFAIVYLDVIEAGTSILARKPSPD